MNTEQKQNDEWGRHDAIQTERNETVSVLLTPTVNVEQVWYMPN